MFTAWSEIEYLATKRLQSLVLITTEYGDIFEKHVKQYPFLLEQIVGMAVQVGEKQRERESFGVSVRTRTKTEAVNLFRIYLGLYVGSYVGRAQSIISMIETSVSQLALTTLFGIESVVRRDAKVVTNVDSDLAAASSSSTNDLSKLTIVQYCQIRRCAAQGHTVLYSKCIPFSATKRDNFSPFHVIFLEYNRFSRLSTFVNV